MLLLRPEIFIIIVFVIGNTQTELRSSKNVCLKPETYQEQIEVKVKKPKLAVEKKWCWNIRRAFSCNKVYTVWEDAVEVQTVNKTRWVNQCCDGYAEMWSGCQPVCLKGCNFGKCVAPEVCECWPGYHGSECINVCPDGLWGINCANQCDCSNNGKCNKVFGACKCEEGWTGLRCESPCPNGYYGYQCTKQCNCDDSTCDHKTGECFTTTTLTTESSPEITTTTEFPSTEKSFEDYHTTKEIKTEDSTSKIFQMTEKDTSIEEETIMSITGASTLEPMKNTKEINSSELISDENVSIDVFANEMTTETSKETKINHYVGSETSFPDALETFTDNNNRETEVTNKMNETLSSETPTVPINSIINDTIQINFSGSKPVIDKTETDNFINEKKGSSNTKTMLKIIHFLPSLSVFSSVSFLIFLIAAMWLIKKHRNKNRKMITKTKKQNEQLQLEDQIKYPTENFFWSDRCINNPDILTDVELNRKTPTLETFKPLNSDKGVFSTEKNVR